jgi:hypothetical protein
MVCHEKVQGISLAVFLQAIDTLDESLRSIGPIDRPEEDFQ